MLRLFLSQESCERNDIDVDLFFLRHVVGNAYEVGAGFEGECMAKRLLEFCDAIVWQRGWVCVGEHVDKGTWLSYIQTSQLEGSSGNVGLYDVVVGRHSKVEHEMRRGGVKLSMGYCQG